MKQDLKSTSLRGLISYLKKLKVPSKVLFILTGIVSTIWFLIRVIPKPSRAGYPCMRVAAPWASAFVVYILSITAAAFSVKKVRFHLKARHLPLAALFFILAVGFSVISLTHSSSEVFSAETVKSIEGPNLPMGTARGIFPGRVVWSFNPDATNINCTNTWGDGYFLDSNTDQDIVDEMLEDVVLRLTEEASLADAWESIFRYHNQERGKGNVGYVTGEKVFIKVNATSTWMGNYSTTDLSRVNNSNYGVTETSPQLVTSVLRHLVNVVGVAQSDIYVGDPLKHIYKDNYEKWYAEFPNVHYLDNSYSTLGRERVVASATAVIDYSDRGTVLQEGGWSSSYPGDPINTDNLYTIFEDMEYMINLPTMKSHERAGVTMFAKNHFGSHTREDAVHLHGGLVNIGEDSLRNDYGMYRVLVDILGHELLGKKNLIYIMDALYSTEQEVHRPVKFLKSPWNNDWTSSILISQDPVAIESVGFDILYNEFDGSNGYPAYPHYGAVDDYLHQAADEANWPAGIIYDPENDGSKIGSLGVHEHWNNPIDMYYSRNLGTGNGIELIKLFPKAYGSIITQENSELPSNQVNSIYVDSSMTIWIGTDAGLSRLTEQNWKHYDTILLNNKVNDLAYEYSTYGKEIWVATNGGLTVAQYTDLDGVTSATTYHPDNSGMSGRKVSSVIVDSSHVRWIGTDSSVSVFQGSTWANLENGIDAMGSSYAFADFIITDIGFVERDAQALLSTEGKGIARMSYNNIDGFTGASTYGQPWSALNTDSIQTIEVDDTLQWYGTDMGLLYHPDTKAKSTWLLTNQANGLVNNTVNTIYVDDDKNTWVGTDAGISIILPDGGIFNYTEADGLLNGQINCLIGDVQGYTWAATSGGIQRFDGITGIRVRLGTPQLTAPANGATDQYLTLDLEWTTVSGATAYHLQVSTDQYFITNVFVDDSYADTTVEIAGLDFETSYFWRVAAGNSNLTGDWSEIVAFETMPDTVLGIPELTAPLNGATNLDIELNLVWTAVPRATGYKLQVSTDPDFLTDLLIDDTYSATTVEISGLDYETTYYWQVAAVNATLTSEWSESFNFETSSMPPLGIPVLAEPVDEAVDQELTLDLIWEAVREATTYSLQVSTDSTFTTGLVYDETWADTIIEITALDYETSYYWRVAALNVSQTGDWSEVFTFKTMAEPVLGIPTLIEPAYGASDQELTLNLVWMAVPGATGYNLQLSTNPTFATDILIDESEVDTALEITGLDYETMYFWHVAAENDFQTSEWSDVFVFETCDGLSVNDYITAPLQICPVPFENYIDIISTQGFITGRISIFGIDGKLYLQEEIRGDYIRFNTSDLEKGVYYLKYVDDKTDFSMKIVK